MSLKDGLPIAAAATAAPVAGTLCWMLVDDISAAQALGSPFPYIMALLSWFVAAPLYVLAQSWVAGKLWRLLLFATLGATPFVVQAFTYFLTPRDYFVAFLILSVAWVSAAAFWAVLRCSVPARYLEVCLR